MCSARRSDQGGDPVMGAEGRCGLEASLAVLGDRWTLSIIALALEGVARFCEFRERLGVASDVLSARLDALVRDAVLERRPYRVEGQRQRHEYVLTTAGRQLVVVVAALSAWDETSGGCRLTSGCVERATGRPVSLAFVSESGRRTPPVGLRQIPGRRRPGTADPCSLHGPSGDGTSENL